MQIKPIATNPKKRGRKSREDIFNHALDKFREQFKVHLRSTGYNNYYESNDGLGEEEYWVEGLINSPMNFEVGGWFSHDTRDKGNTIYCLLAVRLDGESLGECKGLQSWYNLETETWDELKWDSF